MLVLGCYEELGDKLSNQYFMRKMRKSIGREEEQHDW